MWKILGALLCCSALAIAAKSCRISLPEDIKGFAPFILTKGAGKRATLKLFRPSKKVTTITEGRSLHLTCGGARNIIVSLGVASLDLTCKAGNFVDLNKNVVALNTMVCRTMPASILKVTRTKCSQNKGVIYKSGVEVYKKFYPIFEICYDKKTETTLYTHNTLHGATVKYNIAESSRPDFNAMGMKYKSSTVNAIYSQTNQIEVFEKIFGKKQTYIDKRNYLARGHLSPDADFMFGYEQYSTYWFTNVAPQYQPINGGNWLKVEKMARSLAGEYGDDIESYNGYLGIVAFPKNAKTMTKVYLDARKEFHIPKYYFKVLWQKSSDSAIVFVSVNNPFIRNGKADEFCTNICQNVNLYHSDFIDVAKGYTFCCALNDFKRKFKGLPKEVKAKNLLMRTIQPTLKKRKTKNN